MVITRAGEFEIKFYVHLWIAFFVAHLLRHTPRLWYVYYIIISANILYYIYIYTKYIYI